MTSTALRLGVCLGLAVFGLVQCGGDKAGPFEGEWSGTSTTTTTGTITQMRPSMANVTVNVNDTKTANGTLILEPSNATGVDILAHFAGDTCYYNFVRSGTMAMTMTGTSCTQSSNDTAMLMLGALAGTNMDNQTTTITVTSGTLSISGSMITLTLAAGISSNHTINDNPDTMMQNMTQTVTGNIMLNFTGTLR